MQTVWGRPPSRRRDHSVILVQQRFCVRHHLLSVCVAYVWTHKKGQEQWLIGLIMITRRARFVN